MSTGATSDGDGIDKANDTDTRYSKTVRFVAYTGVPASVDEREAADQVDPEYDYLATETDEREKWVAHMPGWNRTLRESEARKLTEADTGDVSVTRYVEKSERYETNTSMLARRVVKDVWGQLDGDVNGGLTRKWRWSDYQADNDARVKKSGRDFSPMRMLKHPDRIEAGDVYTDSEEREWAVSFNVVAEDCSAAQMKWVNARVFERIPELLAEHDVVRRVRYTDCVEERSQKGVCYDF